MAFQSLLIYQRRCTVFVPVASGDQLCHCNRIKDEHPIDKHSSISNGKWQRDVHTMKDPTKEQGVSMVNGAPVGEIWSRRLKGFFGHSISIFDVILKLIQ